MSDNNREDVMDGLMRQMMGTGSSNTAAGTKSKLPSEPIDQSFAKAESRVTTSTHTPSKPIKRSYYLTPEIIRALDRRAYKDKSCDLSGHVREALLKYLAEDIVAIKTELE